MQDFSNAPQRNSVLFLVFPKIAFKSLYYNIYQIAYFEKPTGN